MTVADESIAMVALVSQLLREGDQRLARNALGQTGPSTVDSLINARILIPDGTLASVICDACDTHHFASVLYGGPNSECGWYCPEVGFVSADVGTVAAVSFSLSSFLPLMHASLSASFGPARLRTRRLEGTETWILGVWQIGQSWTTVALSRESTFLSATRRNAALEALPRSDAGLILEVAESASFDPPRGFGVLHFTSSVAFDREGHLSAIDNIFIRAVASQMSETEEPRLGRPSLEADVFNVIKRMLAAGTTANAISVPLVERAWAEMHQGKPRPARSTIRGHVRTWRSRHL
jgi:hypothetical protein